MACKYCKHFDDDNSLAEEMVNTSDMTFGVFKGKLVTDLMLLPDIDPDQNPDDADYGTYDVPVMIFDSWISTRDSDTDIISETFKIKYCPFCGRDLEEVIKNNK